MGLVLVGETVISEDLLDVPLLHVTCGPPNERLLAVLLQLSGVWCRCGCVPLGWSEPLWAVCGCISLRDWFGRIPLLGELVLRSVLALGFELRAVWTELRPVGLSPPPPATETVVLDVGPNTLGRWGELLLARGGKLLLVLLLLLLYVRAGLHVLLEELLLTLGPLFWAECAVNPVALLLESLVNDSRLR